MKILKYDHEVKLGAQCPKCLRQVVNCVCHRLTDSSFRERYIEEFHEAMALEVLPSPTCTNYIPSEVVAKIVDYRLNWLFDSYDIVPKCTLEETK